MRQDKDRSSKWLLGRHGDAILRMAGITDFTAWRQLPTEVVAPRRIFDGLLEVRFADDPTPSLVLIEIESYAGSDADRQVFDDLLLVTLEHRAVPEVLSLVLRPKGNVEVSGSQERASRRGTTRLRGSWPVVRVWELDADALLASGDVGMVPWAALARTDREPAELLGECVSRIDRVPDEVDRAGLMATTEILAGLAFPQLRFPNLFRGPGAMIESPILDEVKEILRQRYEADGSRKLLLSFLEGRFGPISSERKATLSRVSDLNRLEELGRQAATCASLDDFFTHVSAPNPGTV